MAIQEELKWLFKLSNDPEFIVPKPLKSKGGKWVEVVSTKGIPDGRHCELFHWIEGRFIGKSIRPKHLYLAGQLIGRLQNARAKTKHRYYWNAEGLLGERAKFGSIDSLTGISTKYQKLITKTRKRLLKKLLAFEKKFPERQGLIHADLHFGNTLMVGSKLGEIDFDDCGYGFFAYDLAIPYMSAQNSIPSKKIKTLPLYQAALIEGYRTEQKWTRDDDEIFNDLITARKLLMLGWLNWRSDNPILKKRLKSAVQRAVKHIRENH